MTPTDTKTWLSRAQASSRAGISLSTVDRWLAAEVLTRYYAGPTRRVRIDQDELDSLVTPVPDAAHTA